MTTQKLVQSGTVGANLDQIDAKTRYLFEILHQLVSTDTSLNVDQRQRCREALIEAFLDGRCPDFSGFDQAASAEINRALNPSTFGSEGEKLERLIQTMADAIGFDPRKLPASSPLYDNQETARAMNRVLGGLAAAWLAVHGV